MSEATSASAAIDLYVARENPALVHVMDALRALVKKTVPAARESESRDAAGTVQSRGS